MKVTVQVTSPVDSLSPPPSPMLRHVLSSRVLHALSVPHARHKRGVFKTQSWLLTILLAFTVFLFWFSHNYAPFFRKDSLTSAASHPFPILPTSSLIKPYKDESPTYSGSSFGVVFDAGSTGSRVHVFEFRRLTSATGHSYTLTGELFQQVTPGLSSFADDPEKAAESLHPLLHAATNHIPFGTCSNTSVVLRATAGLRLLPSNKAERILTAVRRMLSQSCLSQSPNSVSILDGNQEGLYLWISLNFLTDRMRILGSGLSTRADSLDQTVGTLDLGGGSTQITFAPREIETLLHAPDGFATSLDSGKIVPKSELKLGRQVYSQSYLGLGLLSARYSMLHTITKRLPPKFILTNDLYTPCFPRNFSTTWHYAGRDWGVRHLPLEESKYTLFESETVASEDSLQRGQPSPIMKTCYAHALHVLRDPVEGNRANPVYPPSGFVVHRPRELSERTFYAFSYVFDLAVDIGLVKTHSASMVSVAQFREAADYVCRNPNTSAPFHCMDLCYITALFHDGYGFPWDKNIFLQKKVRSHEISWGLGALFAELASR